MKKKSLVGRQVVHPFPAPLLWILKLLIPYQMTPQKSLHHRVQVLKGGLGLKIAGHQTLKKLF